MSDDQESKRVEIEYVPPPDQVIDKYAKDVCSEIAKRENDDSYNKVEIWGGLAGFLKVAARIEAKRLTKKANQEE